MIEARKGLMMVASIVTAGNIYSQPQIVDVISTVNYEHIYTKYSEQSYIYNKNQIDSILHILKNEIESDGYKVLDLAYEKDEEEDIFISFRVDNFPEDGNKYLYSMELIDRLADQLPENIDIYIV